MKIIFYSLLVFVFGCQNLVAQSLELANDEDIAWVQLEARTQLASAIERAQEYAQDLVDVNGFSLGAGWYGIAVGPYTREDAKKVMDAYKDANLIPSDSFIASSSAMRQQFWPIGANVLNRGVIAAPVQPTQEAQIQTTPEDTTQNDSIQIAEEQAEPILIAPDETKSEALRAERKLSKQEKRDLQNMLKWAGFYNARVDGLFGRGTRNSMAAWQEANTYEVTGIMTTAQRGQLREQYNAILNGLGMALLQDETAGIEIAMPTEAVVFDKYDYPFAHYKSANDIGAQVILISQAGDRNTLFGLYDIMQTLDIVPLKGERERKNNSFVLIGESDEIISETHVSLKKGHVKGFTLIWPTGDEERRQRVLNLMTASMVHLPSVLDPSRDIGEDEAVNLISGLRIRTPEISRSGFFTDSQGTVVTSADAVENCGQITLDQEYEAKVLQVTKDGLAVLEPVSALSPLVNAVFSPQPLRLKSKIAVGGYSYEGLLSGPSVTFGSIADLRGLNGEENLNRLSLNSLSGDFGGPVLDEFGTVVGMLSDQSNETVSLPEDVRFALTRDNIHAALSSAGKTVQSSQNEMNMLAPEDISSLARDMTVLVSCWK